MRDLSLHILDIIENGLAAGASLITLTIKEERAKNLLKISITDNGRGIPEELIREVLNPFYTTRTTRRVGLGLSLFRETSRRCEGDFDITSKEGKGTEVHASFRRDHIDLPPLGDMGTSMTTLIMGNPAVDIVYTHEVDGQVFELDTRRIKEELEDVPINHPNVIRYLGDSIRESLEEMGAGKFASPAVHS